MDNDPSVLFLGPETHFIAVFKGFRVIDGLLDVSLAQYGPKPPKNSCEMPLEVLKTAQIGPSPLLKPIWL